MKIRITPGAVLFLLVMARGGGVLLPAVLFTALWHECGHLLAARLLHVPIHTLELDLFGAKLYTKGSIRSYRAEATLAAAGPLFSLILAFLFLPFGGAFFRTAKTLTLSFALFNLLPIKDFDGGRILSSLLSPLCGTEGASAAVAASSYLSLLFLFTLSSCILLREGEKLSLAVLSASLFARLFLLSAGRE